MKTGIRAGKSYKEQYQAYKVKGTYAKNKEVRLVRHILAHPNDTQAFKAIKSPSFIVYKRKAPRHRGINTGMPLYDKRTKQVTERVKLTADLFPNLTQSVKTVADQMLDLGIITRIPKRYDKQSNRVSKKSK